MRLKDLSTPLWLLVLLLGLEAGLELRAHLRGWETLLLGPGPIQLDARHLSPRSPRR